MAVNKLTEVFLHNTGQTGNLSRPRRQVRDLGTPAPITAQAQKTLNVETHRDHGGGPKAESARRPSERKNNRTNMPISECDCRDPSDSLRRPGPRTEESEPTKRMPFYQIPALACTATCLDDQRRTDVGWICGDDS